MGTSRIEQIIDLIYDYVDNCRTKALAPDKATTLFDYFTDKCRELVEVETGEFGAFMKVNLLNNGPVTILLEKEFE